jgi:iron complex transport system permease protein
MNELVTRFLVAFISGSLISISGSLIQIITQNDLAGPSTLGFEAFAVLIVLSVHFFALFMGFDYSENVILSSLFILLVLLFVNRRFFKTLLSKQYILLIGLCFNLFVGAIFSLIQFLFLTLNQDFPHEIWFGHFKNAQISNLVPLLIVFALTIFFILKKSKELRVLGFGENIAKNLNLEVDKIFYQFWFLSLFLTGLVTIYFGVFSFLSLIFPHLLRSHSFFRSKPAHELIWGSFLSGLILAFLDQICAHILYYNSEIPVGMLTAVAGSFGLMMILLKKNLQGDIK